MRGSLLFIAALAMAGAAYEAPPAAVPLDEHPRAPEPSLNRMPNSGGHCCEGGVVYARGPRQPGSRQRKARKAARRARTGRR